MLALTHDGYSLPRPSVGRTGAAPTDKYLSCAQIAKNLKIDVHYAVSKKDQKVDLTPEGFKFAEQIVGKSLFDLKDPWAFYIVNALKAKELFAKDQEYIVRSEDNTIAIVDAFSGRVLEGRRFTDGLQQSIEAKEGVPVSGETQVRWGCAASDPCFATLALQLLAAAKTDRTVITNRGNLSDLLRSTPHTAFPFLGHRRWWRA